MELIDLEKSLLSDRTKLGYKLEELREAVKKSAETEYAYRIALASKMLELRAQGEPATIMSDICRGDKVVAKLKLERDIARGLSDAARQSVVSLQSSISGLQTLITAKRAEMQLI